MPKLFLPKWVNEHLLLNHKEDKLKVCKDLSLRLLKYKCNNPEVSIVIPAWNEEGNILSTLSSLANQKSELNVELIIVNNNSTDNTQKYLDECGVISIIEPVQSISFARQRGLISAKGNYLLNADADSIYPPDWIDSIVNCLKNKEVVCVYGKHSFIPNKQINRLQLALYEVFSNAIYVLRKQRKEYLNVLGFNFGCRKSDAIFVGGFNTDRHKWSDGWMGMRLAEIGKLKRITQNKTVVWTNSRRLIIDGGLLKSFVKRINKETRVLIKYFIPDKYVTIGK